MRNPPDSPEARRLPRPEVLGIQYSMVLSQPEDVHLLTKWTFALAQLWFLHGSASFGGGIGALILTTSWLV